MLAMCHITFYSFHFPLSNLFEIFPFELMVQHIRTKTLECQVEKMSITDTCFTSSIEALKLKRPPETFAPSTEKTLLLKEQPKNGLRALSKAILT
jgi:hypothetical protein